MHAISSVTKQYILVLAKAGK